MIVQPRGDLEAEVGSELSIRAFELLERLKADNTREWFDAHRDAVRRELQLPFERVLEEVTARLAGSEMPLRGGRATMFRMNRDIRFSRDNSPYNTHVSGVLTRSGTKAANAGLVYLHLDESGGFIAAGAYKLEPKDLGPSRDRIVDGPDRFRGLLDDLAGAGLDLAREFALRSMPQGYAAHAEAWYAPYLKLQAFMARRDLPREDWTGGRVVERVTRLTLASASLIRFTAPA